MGWSHKESPRAVPCERMALSQRPRNEEALRDLIAAGAIRF